MHTGVCPGCKVRRVLVRINYVVGQPESGNVLRVRTHECGSLLEPRDVRPLPRLAAKESIHA
jgi:hypothetical protein